MSAYAALRKESRMNFAEAAYLDRKSGGAKWSDLLCAFLPNNFRLSDCSPNLLSRLKWSEEKDKKALCPTLLTFQMTKKIEFYRTLQNGFQKRG
jgi:hypothetical protein